MNKIVALACLVLLPGLAGAVQPVSVERVPGAPGPDPASEQISCTTTPSPVAGRAAITSCLTAGQRAAQAANAAALAQRATPAQPAVSGLPPVPNGHDGQR